MEYPFHCIHSDNIRGFTFDPKEFYLLDSFGFSTETRHYYVSDHSEEIMFTSNVKNYCTIPYEKYLIL